MQRGFVSFFSGALGLDLGLEQAGLEPLALNEVDRWALATIRRVRPGVPLLDCDVGCLDSGAVLRACRERPFAVVGGPPCQSFSTAGCRRGLSDLRGNVFLHFVQLACDLAPEFIVVENVRGLLSAPLQHRPHRERGEGFAELAAEEMPGGALRRIVGDLEARGYGVSFQLYNVANFGVPQSRERLVLIARRGGLRVPLLSPTHLEDDWATFRSAVAGLSCVGSCAQLRPGRDRYLRLLGPGQNWRDLPAGMQREALGRAYESSGGRVGFCRRVAWDRPSPTLVTCPTMPATELVHPEELRPLSVNEYKRLQTFPDGWEVQGPLTAQYRQIGNAVPVMFGRAIGEHLLMCAQGDAARGEGARASRYRNTDDGSWRRLHALA